MIEVTQKISNYAIRKKLGLAQHYLDHMKLCREEIEKKNHNFELVKDSTDLNDETRNLVDAIIEKNEEIARLNEDIQSIKNKRVCPDCNANIDAESSYCNNCGTKLD